MYTTFYNLREDPFRLTSDPRFFHLAEPHGAALAAVLDAVMRRKGFMVMTGPIGTGKTTVVHMALQVLTQRAASSSPLASAFILNPMLSRDEFLEMLLTEFEIPCTATSKPARLAALQRMLLSTQRQGGTSVLLVDEAHLLSPELLEEIRLLSNSDTYKEKLLQIVLCGQPELMQMLQKPELRALKQRIATKCALRPLTLTEVRSYVAERLSAAGLRGTSPFSPSALEAVFELTQGVPRLINLLCDGCMASGAKLERRTIDAPIVQEVALELGINEKVQPERAETTAAAGRDAANAANDAVIGSALDLLVTTLKRERVSESEPEGEPRVASAATKRSAASNSTNGKQATNDAAIQTAVDVLIQAMKLRRTSTLEL